MTRNRSRSAERRYKLTLEFMKEALQPPVTILDLGTPNPLSEQMKREGITVLNTDVDLDRHPERLRSYERIDICTAFEIFEHLLNPMSVLENLPCNRLFASVPLSLWFSSAYRNQEDPWDRHFHEFEEWQFDWLLDHTGWTIIRREHWTNPAGTFGIRPFLRLFTPRWYVVEAVREGDHSSDEP